MRGGRQDHGLSRRILEAAVLFSANPGRMLPAAIEPMTSHGSAFDQGPIGVDAGPVREPFHKLLLDRLRQNILENLH